MIMKGVYFNKSVVALIKLVGKMTDSGNTYKMFLYKTPIFTHTTNVGYWWTSQDLDENESGLLNNLLKDNAHLLITELL